MQPPFFRGLPGNPTRNAPLPLVPKRWLRFSPWIKYDDYFAAACVKDGTTPKERVAFGNRVWGASDTLPVWWRSNAR